MNLDHHHRRIHWKTRLIRWGLAPLAFAAIPTWLYVSYGTCQEDGDALGSACHALRIVPFLPTLVALALAAAIVWDLVEIGRDLHHETHGVKPPRHLKHAHAGFRALNPHHQKHVHKSLWSILAVTTAVIVWIAWQIYQSTY